MISSEKAYQVIAIASKPGTETDALLNKLQKVDKIDLDQFMEYSMLAWATNQDEEIEKWQKLFELADSNQDGVLTLSGVLFYPLLDKIKLLNVAIITSN